MKTLLLLFVLFVSPACAYGSEIHEAVGAADVERVKKILAEKPEAANELREKDKRGITPLIMALMAYDYADKGAQTGTEKPDPEKLKQQRAKCVEVIRILLEHKANPKTAELSEKRAPLSGAAAMGILDAVQLLVEHGADLNQKDGDGTTPLMGAAAENNLEVVKYLLEKGADINARDNIGGTALMCAVDHGNGEVVKYLLKKDADIKAVTNVKENVLHIYAHGFHPDHPDTNGEILKMLLESGADVTAKNADALTPVMVAEKSNQRLALTLVLAGYKRTSMVGKWKTKTDVARLLEAILATRPKAAEKMTEAEKKKMTDTFISVGNCETHEFSADGKYTYAFELPKELQVFLRDVANGCETEDTKKSMVEEFEQIIATSGSKANGTWQQKEQGIAVELKSQDGQSWKPNLIAENGELSLNGFMNRTNVVLIPALTPP